MGLLIICVYGVFNGHYCSGLSGKVGGGGNQATGQVTNHWLLIPILIALVTGHWVVLVACHWVVLVACHWAVLVTCSPFWSLALFYYITLLVACSISYIYIALLVACSISYIYIALLVACSISYIYSIAGRL